MVTLLIIAEIVFDWLLIPAIESAQWLGVPAWRWGLPDQIPQYLASGLTIAGSLSNLMIFGMACQNSGRGPYVIAFSNRLSVALPSLVKFQAYSSTFDLPL